MPVTPLSDGGRSAAVGGGSGPEGNRRGCSVGEWRVLAGAGRSLAVVSRAATIVLRGGGVVPPAWWRPSKATRFGAADAGLAPSSHAASTPAPTIDAAAVAVAVAVAPFR